MNRSRNRLIAMLGGAAALALGSTAGAAHVEYYFADLKDINNLGASGRADLAFDTTTNELTIKVEASGLDEGIHVMHIHGLVDPKRDSTTPTLANDDDGDGFIELAEGLPSYGPILLAISSPPGLDPLGSEGGFPTSTSFLFEQTFDLDDSSLFAAGFTIADLLPLVLREIVVHGALLGAGDGANGGEADGTPGFKAALPVLSGEIQPIPIPGAAIFLLSGVAAAAMAKRKKRAV